MRRPTNLRRLSMWQSRRVQDAALYIVAFIAAIAMSIVW